MVPEKPLPWGKHVEHENLTPGTITPFPHTSLRSPCSRNLLGPQLGPGHFASSLGEPFGQGPFFDLSPLRCNLGEGAEANALAPLTGSGTCCQAATTSAVSGPVLEGFSPILLVSQKSRDSTQTFTSPLWPSLTLTLYLLPHSAHSAHFWEPG